MQETRRSRNSIGISGHAPMMPIPLEHPSALESPLAA